MSGTALTPLQTEMDGSEYDDVRLSVNKAVDDMEVNRRLLSVQNLTVGNVTTAETDLATYTVPASKLSGNQAGLRLRFWGTSANNANAKTLKIYWNAVAVHTVSLTASIAGRWTADLHVFKTGSNTQDWVSEICEAIATMAAGKEAIDAGTGAATDTGAVVVKATGTATSTNDIVCKGVTVEYLPLAADLTAYKVNSHK